MENFNFYRVVIGEAGIPSPNSIELELDRDTFASAPLNFFVELGFVVTVHKIKKDLYGKI